MTFFPVYITAEDQVKAGECGAIETITNAMRTQMHNGDICKYGCSALMNITNDGNMHSQTKHN